MLRILRLSLLLLLPLQISTAQVLPQSIGADYPGLDIQAEYGWDGFVDYQTPTAISFLISNNSSEVLEGNLVLREPNGFRSLVLGSVTVAPGSTRQFGSVLQLQGWDQCEATWEGPQGILWQRPLTVFGLRQYSSGKAALLSVEDGGRSLKFPGVAMASGGTLPGDYVPANGIGSQVMPISIAPWQMPVHPGPLTALRAVLLAKNLRPESLNDAQWDALGRWVCMGGLVFISRQNDKLVSRLLEACPLRSHGPPDDSASLALGSGSLYRLPPATEGATDELQQLRIAEIVSLEPPRILPGLCRDLEQTDWSTPSSEQTLVRVMAVLLIYAVTSTLTLLMFRSNRRRILIWTLSVVLLGCLGAAIAGISVRMSRGDMNWSIITEPAAGGTLQHGIIRLNSAGGSSFRVAVQGHTPDVQINHREPDRRGSWYNYGQSEHTESWPAFSLSPDLSLKTPETYEILVPISPWGERHLRAIDVQPQNTTPVIQLSYQPDADGNPLNGRWNARVEGLSGLRPENLSLKFRILHTTTQEQQTIQQLQETSRALLTHDRSGGDAWVAEFVSAPLSWQPQPYDFWRDSESGPDLAPGMAQIWLEGTLPAESLLQIDETRTEFHAIDEPRHQFLYQLPQSAIPAEWLQLLRTVR